MERKSFCYVWLPTCNEVGVVKYGESGYYQTNISECSESMVDYLNERMGVSKTEAALMTALSMGKRNTLEDWDRAFEKL